MESVLPLGISSFQNFDLTPDWFNYAIVAIKGEEFSVRSLWLCRLSHEVESQYLNETPLGILSITHQSTACPWLLIQDMD